MRVIAAVLVVVKFSSAALRTTPRLTASVACGSWAVVVTPVTVLMPAESGETAPEPAEPSDDPGPPPSDAPARAREPLLPTGPDSTEYRLVTTEGVGTVDGPDGRRFLTVATQTVLAPMVTTLLFLAVFVLAMGHSSELIGGVPYMEFLAPGLIMMAMTQNAFANTTTDDRHNNVENGVVYTVTERNADQQTGRNSYCCTDYHRNEDTGQTINQSLTMHAQHAAAHQNGDVQIEEIRFLHQRGNGIKYACRQYLPVH